MESVRRLRVMASLCRQTAAYHPDRSCKLLAEAEYWERLANAALLEHFKECTASSNDLNQAQSTTDANHTRWTMLREYSHAKTTLATEKNSFM
jgi:hypothetical protein